jgi:hypothetical protein
MLADPCPQGGQCTSHEQATLTGETSEIVNDGELEANRLKGEQESSKHAKARVDDAQATLSESAEQHGDWVGCSSMLGTKLSRASPGRVYTGQVPLIIGSA